MKSLSIALMLALSTKDAFSFAPNSNRILSSRFETYHSMSALSDAEELLRKARELREQAEAEEHSLHQTLISKKETQNVETDHVIDEVFPIGLPKGKAGAWKVAEILEKNRYSANCLDRVVERLHEREIAAKGVDHVEPSVHHTHVKFERVQNADAEELARIEGLLQILIDAAAILDEKVLKEHSENGTKVKHHVDASHWCSGKLSQRLDEKAHFLGREHDEQFKSRLEEFNEAVRKKKHNKTDRNETTRLY